MKRIFIFSILFLAILACNKKAIPTIPERAREEKEMRDPMPVNVIPDLERGKSIFMNRCARCHDLPKPDQYTATRWEKILDVMNKKANLNQVQEVHVRAYIKENSKK